MKKKKSFQNDKIKGGGGGERLKTQPLTVLRVIVCFRLQKNRACHVSWCTIILIQVEREAGGGGGDAV
jgi:hypothetical protein